MTRLERATLEAAGSMRRPTLARIVEMVFDGVGGNAATRRRRRARVEQAVEVLRRYGFVEVGGRFLATGERAFVIVTPSGRAALLESVGASS